MLILAAALLLFNDTIFTGEITTTDNTVIRTQEHAATVLIFTTTDCPIAKSQQPTFTKLYNSFQPNGVAFVAIQINPELEKEELDIFVSEFKTPLPQSIDKGHKLVQKFKATITPEVFILNKQGQVVYQGATDNSYPEIGVKKTPTKNYVSDALTAILAGKAPSPAKTKAVGCIIPSLDDF